MAKLLKCLECGEEIERITNAHLMQCCNLSMAEYAVKHTLDLSELVLPSVLKKSAYNKNIAAIKNIKEYNAWEDLPKDTKQVILGSLLGDSYLQYKRICGYNYLECWHGVEQLQYLRWKGYMLREMGTKLFQRLVFNKVANRITSQQYIKTPATSFFRELTPKIYRNGKKYISGDILDQLSSLGVAVWFMDIGSFNGYNYVLHTTAFDIDSLLTIQKWFKQKWGVAAEIQEDLTLSFETSTSDRFVNKIKPYVIPLFNYKINTKMPEMIVTKCITLDYGHFLESHKSKCFQAHGHLLQLEISVKGPMDPVTGMVLDFSYIKYIIKKYIVDLLDHHIVNYIVPELRVNATVEMLALWMWKTLIEFIPGLYKIKLYETPNSYIEYQGPSHAQLKKKNNEIDSTFNWYTSSWKNLIERYPEILEYNVVDADTYKATL